MYCRFYVCVFDCICTNFRSSRYRVCLIPFIVAFPNHNHHNHVFVYLFVCCCCYSFFAVAFCLLFFAVVFCLLFFGGWAGGVAFV